MVIDLAVNVNKVLLLIGLQFRQLCVIKGKLVVNVMWLVILRRRKTKQEC